MKTDEIIITIKGVIKNILANEKYIDIINGIDEVVSYNDLYEYIDDVSLDKNNYENVQPFLLELISNIKIIQNEYYDMIAKADLVDDENGLYDVEISDDVYLICMANLIRFLQTKINAIDNAIQKTKNKSSSDNNDYNIFNQFQKNIVEIILLIFPNWYEFAADRKIYDHFIVKHYFEINQIDYTGFVVLTKEQKKEIYYELRNSRVKKADAIEGNNIIDEDEGAAGDNTTGVNTIKKIEQEMDRDYFYQSLPWLEQQSLSYLFRGGEIPEILKTYTFDGLRMIQRRIIIRSLAHFNGTEAE